MISEQFPPLETQGSRVQIQHNLMYIFINSRGGVKPFVPNSNRVTHYRCLVKNTDDNFITCPWKKVANSSVRKRSLFPLRASKSHTLGGILLELLINQFIRILCNTSCLRVNERDNPYKEIINSTIDLKRSQCIEQPTPLKPITYSQS